MFRKPRLKAPTASVPGRPPSPPASATPSSPPSPKKQKTNHPTSTKTPKRAKQSLLTPLPFSTPPSTASSGKSKPKKNGSILSFFKPVEGEVGKDKKVRGMRENSDDLFIKHGGYGLDVSDPEDEESEDDNTGDGEWTSKSNTSESVPKNNAQDREGEDDKRNHSPGASVSAGVNPSQNDEIEDSQITQNNRRGTPPPPSQSSSISSPSTQPLPKMYFPNSEGLSVSPILKFDPSSIKFDPSRSILFMKKGSIPTQFKSLKRTRAASETSSSASEEDISEEIDPRNEAVKGNRSMGEYLMHNKPQNHRNQSNEGKDRGVEGGGSSGEQESNEFSVGSLDGQNPIVGRAGDVRTTDSDFNSKYPNTTLDDKSFDDVDDCEEEMGFEEREGNFDFDPAYKAIEGGFEDYNGDFEDLEVVMKPECECESDSVGCGTRETELKCPICTAFLGALSEADANNHVNHCLDGDPIPLPTMTSKPKASLPSSSTVSSFFSNRSPIESPTTASRNQPSAFSKLMSTNTEAAAWSAAAKSETSSRGKRASERLCPFYKILFSGSITVDAFRYGAIPGCSAYFLSHFHSDHYIGLTSKWNHGPIWCSRVTANLVRSKLGVDPEFVREMPWEEWADVEPGIRVRGLDANHCPGSMLFLFEKELPAGKQQRVLHCGDFRASPEHLKHPLLSPGKDGTKGQRIDTCYLDTTYLNPKYAFPLQGSVIEACMEMCTSLNKEKIDSGDSFESAKREAGIGKFVARIGRKNGDVAPGKEAKSRGRLLVVVGTYSIGKERICMGIAKALSSKIYAPAAKLRICEALEDEELNSLLTRNPKEAQVHMTPLMEIRAETLQDYLTTLKPHFTRIVGFRPSGWNYRPPNARSLESPPVTSVLHSPSWKSEYSARELVPQRGSTKEAQCFGVPYSEHSSFRELTMFCCGLNLGKIVPTVNIGSAKSRGMMKSWFDKWEAEKKKNGLFSLEDGNGSSW